ncbi:hypothetical protein ACLK2A_01830 [Escherichia coli]
MVAAVDGGGGPEGGSGRVMGLVQTMVSGQIILGRIHIPDDGLMGNVAALFHSGSRHVGAGSGGLNIGYIQWTRFAAMTYQASPNTHS